MSLLSPGDVKNSSPAGTCTLSSDVEIEGSITFQKELLIDGKSQGQINSDGVLTIGENADVRGEIKTKSVTVHGKVHGNITAERCELKSKCTLEGDLKAARLIIEEGATFIGKAQIALTSTGDVFRKLYPALGTQLHHLAGAQKTERSLPARRGN